MGNSLAASNIHFVGCRICAALASLRKRPGIGTMVNLPKWSDENLTGFNSKIMLGLLGCQWKIWKSLPGLAQILSNTAES